MELNKKESEGLVRVRHSLPKVEFFAHISPVRSLLDQVMFFEHFDGILYCPRRDVGPFENHALRCKIFILDYVKNSRYRLRQRFRKVNTPL